MYVEPPGGGGGGGGGGMGVLVVGGGAECVVDGVCGVDAGSGVDDVGEAVGVLSTGGGVCVVPGTSVGDTEVVPWWTEVVLPTDV